MPIDWGKLTGEHPVLGPIPGDRDLARIRAFMKEQRLYRPGNHPRTCCSS